MKNDNGDTGKTPTVKEKTDECPSSPSMCVRILSPKRQSLPKISMDKEKPANDNWSWRDMSVYHVGWLVFLGLVWIYIFLSKAHGWKWPGEGQLSLLSLPVQTDWRLLITPKVSCADDPPFAALVTMTGAADAEARAVVRSTWGGVSRVGKRRLRVFFLLGTQASEEVQETVVKEAAMYGDILQHSAPDKYRNLTYKTITAFRWIANACPEAKFLIKADADVFLDVNKLVDYLNAHQDEPDVAAGVLRTNVAVVRERTHRNYEDPAVYSQPKYPPYLSGPLYIISGDLVAKIAAVAKWLPVLSNEDCFVGTCLQALGVQPQSSAPGAIIDVFFRNFSDISDLRKWMAIHPIAKERLLALWQELH
ncbi:hypothetical protein, conserved [Eimeria maxima]|uniref:Hexosyltransferase n=1 Tax=Eimeria maxima TaxID=5804 RepID=U6M3Q5_EIMMA|nr:hypothetical protein, conserved [Eimeria maxima]CDJ58867.1 hypothetical protein, conserved [Eimeria maxima]